MGFPNPFKAAKKALTKVAKPFRKISQKFIPKELRWAAPYLAAVAPYTSFMMPGTGIMSSALGRSALSGLYNVAGQAIADPEGDDVNLLSTLLAGGQGYLTSPGMSDRLMDMTTQGGLEGVDPGLAKSVMENRSLLTKAKDLGLTGASKVAGLAEGAGDTLADLASLRRDPFTVAGAKAGLKAITPALGQGTGDLTKSMADQQWRAFDEAEAAAQAEFDATSTADKQERADLTMRYYREAGHDEETIQTALEVNDLAEFYEPPVEEAAEGGIIGLKNGGIMMASYDYNDAMAEAFDAYERAIKDGIIPSTMEFDEYLELMRDSKKEIAPQGVQMAAQGGIIGLKHGGMLNFGGREMDLRGGGFVPIGKKEKADDVPARLSKNEFVMTADAVRAAGGGDVNKGAQRMYNVMNNLEARA